MIHKESTPKNNNQRGAVLAEYAQVLFYAGVVLLTMIPMFMRSVNQGYQSRSDSMNYTNRAPLLDTVESK